MILRPLQISSAHCPLRLFDTGMTPIAGTTPVPSGSNIRLILGSLDDSYKVHAPLQSALRRLRRAICSTLHTSAQTLLPFSTLQQKHTSHWGGVIAIAYSSHLFGKFLRSCEAVLVALARKLLANPVTPEVGPARRDAMRPDLGQHTTAPELPISELPATPNNASPPLHHCTTPPESFHTKKQSDGDLPQP
jgi:hypothetical protein